jgi:hypothetical protein
MKTMVMAVVMVWLAVGVSAQDNGHKVTVLSEKMDVLYLKVSESYVGASLIVMDATGARVMETSVSSRKVLVDFIDQVSGDYTIRIEQGEFSEELKYHKM